MTAGKGRIDFTIRGLLITTGIAAVMPSILLGVYALSDLVARDQEVQRSHLRDVAYTLLVAVDREFDALVRKAKLLAGTRQIVSAHLGSSEELLSDAALATGHGFVLFDSDGQQLVQAGVSTEVTSASHTAQRVQKVSSSGQVRIERLGEALAVLVPVPSGERGTSPRRVLALLPMRHHFSRFVASLPLPDGWVAAVDDPENVIIARSEKAGDFVGRSARLQTPKGGSGLVNFNDLEDRPSLMAYHGSPLTGFRAVVWAPEETFYGASTRLAHWAISIGGLTLVLTVLGGIAAAEISGRPIRQLAAAARRLEDGGPVHHDPTVMREANVAGRAMEHAAATIANREARLTAETEKTSFLLQELAHRVKNLLAVVSAIARQTARTVDQSSEFTEQFQARMSGLAATVDLLAKSDWHGVSLENLITRQLEAFGEADRIRMSGPHLLLSPNATEYAGLAVHELATNSVKYGALSGQGHVSIEWAVESDTFRLAWQEAGGPPVASPERCGFGRTVVETIVPQALMGQAELRFGPDGVSWELHAPRGHVIARRSDTR